AIFTLVFSNMFRGFYKRQMALIQEYGGQLELLYRIHYERGEFNFKPTLNKSLEVSKFRT
ncbi:MAG: hypothetical protein F6K34_28450, partial [Okeania sp. SIO4D6]|nr:hypothetical protein [Okeania sp. SIO4D6]